MVTHETIITRKISFLLRLIENENPDLMGVLSISKIGVPAGI